MNTVSIRSMTIRIENIAFLYWFFAVVKNFVIYIFFSSSPELGTLANGLISASFAFAVFATTPLTKHRNGYVKLSAGFKLSIILMLWAAITILWTHSSSRFNAAAYLMVTVLDCYVVFGLFKIGDSASVTAKSIQGIVWGALLLGGVTLVSGASAGGGRLGDENFLHPNTFGNQMGIACLCSIWITSNCRFSGATTLFGGIMSFILFLALLLSLSKTAIIAFIVAVAIFMMKTKNSMINKSTFALLLLSAGLLMSTHLNSYFDNYLNKTQEGDALSTVSGRSYIWEKTWEMIKEQPLQGYGFMSFRDYGPQTAEIQVVHAHNEWLHIWFTLGLVGVVLVASVYLAFYIDMRKAYPVVPSALLGSTILVYSLVRGLTEASPNSLVFSLPLLLLFLGSVGNEKACQVLPCTSDSAGIAR